MIAPSVAVPIGGEAVSIGDGGRARAADETPPAAFFERDVATVARALIGLVLDVEGVSGRVVETEAYDSTDPASHSFRGRTVRNAAMFDAVGRAYVYRSYGLHWCLNIVCGTTVGGAVLIRALEPLDGIEIMMRRRGTNNVALLCSGPGRLCQALAVDGSYDGRPLDRPPIRLFGTSRGDVEAGSRIGLSRAKETPWRFWLSGSPFVSRRPRRVARDRLT